MKLKKDFPIINIRNDHNGEFISYLFEFFVKKNDITLTFQHIEFPNKIRLSKGKTGLFKKWQEQC
jgi:hypothetical protein